MTFEEQVIQELKLLKANATAYQVVKELDLGKSTVYRLFKDFRVNDFQFETISKLVDYSRKLERERKENEDSSNVLFQYRNERIVLAQQITAQPLLWHSEVTCEAIEKPTEIDKYLVQLDLKTRALEYSIYPYIPSHNNSHIEKDKEYIAELSTNFNLTDNAMEIGIEVIEMKPHLDEIKKEVVLSGTLLSVNMGNLDMEMYREDLLYLGSLFRQYLASHLTEKSGNIIGFNYYVAQEIERKAPRKAIKKVNMKHTHKMNYMGTVYNDISDVFYELEELLEGKPYQVSTNYAYERLNGVQNEFAEVIPTIEMMTIGDKVMVFLKHYNADGITLSTQLLINAYKIVQLTDDMDILQNDDYFGSMVRDFMSQTNEQYEELAERYEDLIFQPVNFKVYM